MKREQLHGPFCDQCGQLVRIVWDYNEKPFACVDRDGSEHPCVAGLHYRTVRS